MRSHLKEIGPTLALAVPIAIAQVSQLLMGLTDSLMIGRLGTVPLAAAAFGGSVFNVFYVAGIGLMIPVAVLVSRCRGSARLGDCGEYLRHGLGLALLCGGGETALIAALSFRLRWFHQPNEVVAIVVPFFLLIGASLTFALVYLSLRQFAEAMGLPWLPTMVMLLGVALNALLDWILIYGHAGFPALGLTGAGVATFVSRLACVALLLCFLRRNPVARAAWPARWLEPLSGARLREMLRLGVPAAGSLLFESGAFAGSSIMAGWLGAAALAAHQIAISCVSVTFMFLLGLAIAAGIRMSAALGAGEWERLRPVGFGALAAGTALAIAFLAAYLVAAPAIASWFGPEPIVARLAVRLLTVAAVFQIFDGAQVICSSSLRGLSDVRIPAVLTFLAYGAVALPFAYLAGFRYALGVVGIWIGLAAGLAFAAICLGLRLAALTGPRADPI